eukprot:TRINITY_DN42913_c0_g1_i1.p1 TRINITY_DN42913_c0_g1~~TRINITY_DN42913_c0_g1_i1.p1  ORF type:complete len:366 (+),score=19.31 TRINITY_DN42913_c0_g1_i1:41-1099(+)
MASRRSAALWVSAQVAAFSILLGTTNAAPACFIPDTRAGLHDGVCGGIHFTYNVPKRCVKAAGSNQTCGVIADVHGWTMNADIQDENTGMRALGEQYGFVVVQPTAKRYPGRLPIPLSPELPLTSWLTTDYPLVWDIVSAARDEPGWNVEPDRVHFMGFSQGSQMTWAMLENHSDEIASAVPMSCAPADPEAVARAAAKVPVLYSQGYNDGLCDFQDGNRTVRILQSAWQLDAGRTVSQDDHHLRTSYTGATGHKLDTVFWDYKTEDGICGLVYEHIGKGHCFPGGSDTKCFQWDGWQYKWRVSFPEKVSPLSCPGPDPSAAAFHIGQEAMRWFLKHPRTPKPLRQKSVVVV